MGRSSDGGAVLAARADERSTTERLLTRYHTCLRRPSVLDGRARVPIIKSLERSLGPWLPADLSSAILDIACGEGALLYVLRERGYTKLAGFDLSPENVALCHALGLGFVQQADALRLGQISGLGRYHTIFALDVLEHLPKQRAAGFLEDVRRLLLPGGCVVIQTPNLGSHLGWYHQSSDLTHEFGLTESAARSLLVAAGFPADGIELRPAWSATTPAGYLREAYMVVLHRVMWMADGAARPRIATRDLLIRATVS